MHRHLPPSRARSAVGWPEALPARCVADKDLHDELLFGRNVGDHEIVNAMLAVSARAEVRPHAPANVADSTVATAKPAFACCRSVSCPKLRCSSNNRPYAETNAATRCFTGG